MLVNQSSSKTKRIKALLLGDTLQTRLHKALGGFSVKAIVFERVDGCRTNLLVGLHHPGAIHWNKLSRKRKR